MGTRCAKMAEDETAPAMVKLKSGDGMEFVIERDAAMVSGTIKNMLSSPGMFVESSGEINFPEIPGVVLEKVCQYFHYKLKFTNSAQAQVKLPSCRTVPTVVFDMCSVQV